MRQEDIEKLFKKPGEKRYDYFIKTVADTEEVYGLMDDEGWALLGDDDDADILPIFPAAEFAEVFRLAADYEEYRVEAIDVTEFIEWLGDMDEENLLVAVFPNIEYNGAVVSPEHLKNDLLKEFEKEKD